LINCKIGKDIYCILCTRNIHYHVHRDPPISSVLLWILAGLNVMFISFRSKLIPSPNLPIFTPSCFSFSRYSDQMFMGLFLICYAGHTCVNRISTSCVDGDFMCMFLPCWCCFSVGLSVYHLAVLSIQEYRVTVNSFNVLGSS
jgi:hypothetical protein